MKGGLSFNGCDFSRLRSALLDLSDEAVSKVTTEVMAEKGDEHASDRTAACDGETVPGKQIGRDGEKDRTERAKQKAQSGCDTARCPNFKITTVRGHETDDESGTEETQKPTEEAETGDDTADGRPGCHPDYGQEERTEEDPDREQSGESLSNARTPTIVATVPASDVGAGSNVGTGLAVAGGSGR